MKKTLFTLVLVLFLTGCNNNPTKTSHESNQEINSDESKPQMTDLIEVISVETGWYQEQRPYIKVKFRNKSDNAISDFIKIKYQFVEDGEIFDEGYVYLHSSSDIDWDSGLSKSKTIISSYGYPYGGFKHNINAKVLFDDNSPIWDGIIAKKFIY